MNRIIIVLAIIVFGGTSLFAQVKVGTTGANFLEISTSVQSTGMGELGTSVLLRNSYQVNPAALGLFSNGSQVSVSLYPTNTQLTSFSSFYNRAVSLSLSKKIDEDKSYNFSIAYFRTKITAGPFVELGGTGRTFSWEDRSDNIVLSFASKGKIDYAFGFTGKLIGQKSGEYSADGFSYDVGSIIRYNIKKETGVDSYRYIIPAVGFSIKNIGSDLTIVSKTTPLPKITSFGSSVVFGLKREFSESKSAQVYNVLAAIEVESRKDDDNIFKLGLDFSLYEFLNFRVGRITEDGPMPSETTFGYTLSTFNFGKFRMLISGGESVDSESIFEIFFNKINIEYNYAKTDYKYHEIVVNLAL